MFWSFVYRLGILLLSAGIRLAGFRSSKAKKRWQAQSNLFSHWEQCLASRLPQQQTIWFHCASLGEFDSIIPVLEQIRCEKGKQWYITVSFFSSSGYEKRKDHPLVDATGYLPLDFPANASRLVTMLKPDIAVFVKYEFWKFHFNAIKKQGARLLVSGVRFAHNTPYFGWLSGMYRPIFSKVDTFLVQDDLSAALLLQKGYRQVIRVGDSRIDRSLQTAEQKKSFPELETVIAKRKVLIVGSTWPEDERVWIPAWKQLQRKPYLIIAPHEPSAERIKNIKAALSIRLGLWSQRDKDFSDTDGIIVDTIGDLAGLYRYATVAYVGGAFGKGLHNIIEPLVFGTPVVFGPKTARFPEAQDATHGGFGLSVQDETTASHALNYFLENAQKEKIMAYLSANKGAAQRIFQEIFQKVKSQTQ